MSDNGGHDHKDRQRRIAELESVVARASSELAALKRELRPFHGHAQLAGLPLFAPPLATSADRQVTRDSSSDDKLALFSELFTGREDVYGVRWESRNGKKKGYAFDCANERQPGCRKFDKNKQKEDKCANCVLRAYIPFDKNVMRGHFRGKRTPNSYKDFVVGSYGLLPDLTCRFIVADFDKQDYQKDVEAFRDECRKVGIPVYLERSRSGNGCHAWVFFSEPVRAHHARRMMLATITKTMEKRPDMGFDSYDRLIPNQDTMPKGGLGNLIALPFQNEPRLNGNSLFVDEEWNPFEDQWAFLSGVKKMTAYEVEKLSAEGTGHGSILGLPMPATEEHAEEPWKMKPSRPVTAPTAVPLDGTTISMRLSNQLYIDRTNLPPQAVAQFSRIGAFQNPEFYKQQARGQWTGETPRVISAAEVFPNHIALPRGCLDDAMELARQYRADIDFHDIRNEGSPLPPGVSFNGELTARQKVAFDSLMAHDMGVLKAPPAFGKTVITIAGIAERQRNTLVIVFTKTVFEQWQDRLRTFLTIDPNLVGWIGDGQMKATGIIDVALIQTLTRKRNVIQYVSDIVENYGQIVVDEVHHISADTFEPVARRAKAKFYLAASATPKRTDGKHPLIFMHFGPVRHKVDAKQAIAESGMAHVYRQRKTRFKVDPSLMESIRSGSASYQDLYKAMAEDEDRNYTIFSDVLLALDRGRCPIVLTTRKDHLEYMYERFRPHAKNVVVLKGGMNARERKLAHSLMTKPSEEERLILATGQFLGEGFDDHRLDSLFMTMPTIWEGTLEQYAGRLQRQYVTKHSVEVTDYVDDDENQVRKAEHRKKVFKRLGFSISLPDESVPVYE